MNSALSEDPADHISCSPGTCWVAERESNADQADWLARKAYQAYGSTTNFKNYQGLPMPAYDDLPEGIRRAWQAAALAVRTA